jgi:hypothetical protein
MIAPRSAQLLWVSARHSVIDGPVTLLDSYERRRFSRQVDRYFTTQSIKAHSKPMSYPAFSLSIHLCRRISLRSARNSLYRVELFTNSVETPPCWGPLIIALPFNLSHGSPEASVVVLDFRRLRQSDGLRGTSRDCRCYRLNRSI